MGRSSGLKARVIGVVSAALFGWSATLAMAVWGVSYLAACWEVTKAPGVPLKLTYAAQGGPHTFWSARYEFDLPARRVRLFGARLAGPRGESILEAASLRAAYDGSWIDVSADRLVGSVVRGRDGTFNVAQAMPAPVKGKVAPSFRFAASSVSLLYVDLTAGEAVRRPIVLERVRVVQDEGDTWATGLASFAGLDRALASYQSGREGELYVRLDGIDGEVASLWPVATRYLDSKTLRDLGQTSADHLRLKGSVSASRGRTGKTSVRGDLEFVADGLVVADSPYGRAEGRVSGSLDRANVVALVDDGDRRASFRGTASAGEHLGLRGSFEARSGSGKLWPALGPVPSGFALRGWSGRGVVAYVDHRLTLGGQGTVASAKVKGEALTGIAARFSLVGDQLTVGVDRARWEGSPLRGAFQTDLRKGDLSGFADLTASRFDGLFKKWGLDFVAASGSAKAVLGGTVKRPQADLYATGRAELRPRGSDPLDGGTFEARMSLAGDEVKVKRLTFDGPNGFVSITGGTDVRTQKLRGEFVAGAVPLSALYGPASGTGFARGTVGGTWKAPKYSARVEAYGTKVEGWGLAQIVADVHGDKDSVSVDSARAYSGAGHLQGSGSIVLKSGEVAGRFSAEDLFLSELFGEDVVGRTRVSEGVVSGTLEKPDIRARVDTGRVTVHGVPLDALSALVFLHGSTVRAEGLEARVQSGTASANVVYDLEKKTGSASGTFKDLPLRRLLRQAQDVEVAGSASGQFEGQWDQASWSGKANAQVADVTVNNTPIGRGQLTAEAQQGTVNVTGDVGSVDRYISLNSLKIRPEEEAFSADVAAYNVRLKDILTVTRPYWLKGDVEPVAWLLDTDGSFTGTATLQADRNAWTLGPSRIALDNLTISGRDAGSLSAELSRVGEQWTVPRVQWKAGNSTLDASGDLSNDGFMNLKATLTDFDLSWIRTFSPSAPFVTGKATATVVASGPKDDPEGRASILADNVVFADEDGEGGSDPVQLLIDDLSFGKRRASLSGHATYLGFTGEVAAQIPYSAFERDQGQARDALVASLTFADRPLSDFRDYLPDVDMDKSEGTAGLTASMSGTWDDLKVSAHGQVSSPRLVSKSLGTELRNLLATFDQKDRLASLKVGVESGAGGRLDTEVRANLAKVFGQPFSVDSLLDNTTVSGSAQFSTFAFAQKLPGAQQATTASVDGRVDVAGTLRSPAVTGGLVLNNLDVRLPQEVGATAAAEFAIDPRFDGLKVEASSGSQIQTGIGALVVTGTGVVNGTLSDIQVNAPLTLQRGVFRLPSGRIALEPGGRINFNYGTLAGSEPAARVDLDLEGHTTVVSRTGAGQYEPYRVTLEIHGNAMDEKSLQITGYSDPPGLSNEEILALVGQRDLIQGLAAGVAGGAGSSDQLRNAFYSIAVPQFSQNLTQGLATSLNLDYLTVDYNPFDQFLVSAGKTLAPGLVLSVTRQLQQSQFGPLRYEVKLEYRLPLADPVLGRIRFGVGLDQNVPWKVTLGWSRRF